MAEEIQRLLECPMCLELFDSSARWPKLLPCQHTLCLECLDMLNQGSKLQCPQCRQEHTCPSEGPQQLPNNFTMLALLDVQQKSSSPLVGPNVKESALQVAPKSESRPPAINEGVRNSIALLAKKLQEKSVELSRIDDKEKQTEDLFLSVKNQVDAAFQARTCDLQARRDQLIKQLAGARQEELAFLQGQRASAYQYLQKLQADFSKMRQALMASAEPREADLINLLSMCRGYLVQIEQYALNIDQRICNVGFTDPSLQQLLISIQAYGCLNISSDKAKSMQAVRPASSFQSASAPQSSPTNPFSPTQPQSVTASSTGSSLTSSSPSVTVSEPSPACVSSSLVLAPAVASIASDSNSNSSGRTFALVGQSTQSPRLSDPIAMVPSSMSQSALSQQPLFPTSQPGSSLTQPVPSPGMPASSQSTRQQIMMRQISMESVGASLPISLSQQPSPAGGDQPPPIPRRPGTVRLTSVSEQQVAERPRSILMRQHTAPSTLQSQNIGSAPPLPPRRNVHIPDASPLLPQAGTHTQITTNTNSMPQNQWVTFDTISNRNPSHSHSKRTVVIGQLFEKPAGVHVLDKLNNCFAVVDELKHCIMIVNEEGRLLITMGSKGGGAGQMQFPRGVCGNSSGNLIISDWYNHKVQIWDLRGKFLRQFGSRGQSKNTFNGPLGVVCDKKDNIYVCDYNNGCVKVYTPLGEFIRQIGKKGERDGQFRNPAYIAFTHGGELLITDAFKHCVQVFSSQGTYLYRFGKWGTGPGDLNCPGGIAVDGQGYIYVANSGNHRIEVFNPSGSYALSIGKHGTEEGLFDEPMGISIARDGRLVVSDSGNKRLQVVWP